MTFGTDLIFTVFFPFAFFRNSIASVLRAWVSCVFCLFEKNKNCRLTNMKHNDIHAHRRNAFLEHSNILSLFYTLFIQLQSHHFDMCIHFHAKIVLQSMCSFFSVQGLFDCLCIYISTVRKRRANWMLIKPNENGGKRRFINTSYLFTRGISRYLFYSFQCNFPHHENGAFTFHSHAPL